MDEVKQGEIQRAKKEEEMEKNLIFRNI